MKTFLLTFCCFLLVSTGIVFSQDLRATTDDGRSVVLKKSGAWFFVERAELQDGKAVVYDGRAVILKKSGTWLFLNNKDPLPVPTHKYAGRAVSSGARASSAGGSYAAVGAHPVLGEYATDMAFSDGSVADKIRLTSQKYVLVYFSAHWCPPCRAFTPKLVEYYKTKGGGNRFEVLFVSDDNSAQEMMNYMTETEMPWMGLRWKSDEARALSEKLCGPGIPCLVLLNANDEVVSHSYVGTKYVGPYKVLADLDRVLQNL